MQTPQNASPRKNLTETNRQQHLKNSRGGRYISQGGNEQWDETSIVRNRNAIISGENEGEKKAKKKQKGRNLARK